MRKLILFALFGLSAGLVACSSSTDTAPAESKPAEATPAPTPAPTPEPAPTPAEATPPKEPAAEPAKPAAPPKEAKPDAAPKADKPPLRGANLKPGLYAHFQTNMGNFTAELNEKEAPGTVASFAGLASGEKEWTDPKTGQKVKKPYYDGLIFHRVIDNFMIQGGDPLGTGTGGPGFTIKDEYNNLKHDKAGVLSMARTPAPDSAGSQFYITVTATPFLDGQRPPYVVFGQVTEGVDIVQKIGKTPTAPGDRPLTPVVIQKITIERVK
jgi:peptidyl-prolyl cis-trans isomerase A (cyclophilin A)